MPANITKYSGQLSSDIGSDLDFYIVSLGESFRRRRFVGIMHERTWSEKGICLFVGNRQGGSIGEVEDPNDPVIEGVYSDYIINSKFETDFENAVFKKEKCNI